ncbi:hypothetical protein PIB30_020890 [Stylosanthes scabra]|uniref:CCHC-type domain-containing protein n=1 Tax=Stylosanthes scabra TaxID=79078 RepID=A0ABU6X6U4_9FABA|nr:hypothetical protein [Stylosanthes scabra]
MSDQQKGLLPPSFRTPSHRPTKKRRRGPIEEEGSNRTRMSWVGQIQKCSNCGAAGHKRRGCPKPLTTVQPHKKSKGKAATRSSSRGKKRSSSQPPAQARASKKRAATTSSSSQPLPLNPSSQPNRGSGRGGPKFRPNQQQPPSQPSSSCQPKVASTKSRKSMTQPTKKSSTASNFASSSQLAPMRIDFSVSSTHVSPKKLKLMAKLPPRKWGNI